MKKHLFVIAQGVALALVVAALMALPGLSLLPSVAVFAVVWVMIAMVYKKTGCVSSLGWYTLLVSATLLAVGVVANVHFFTIANGGTISSPIVENPDMERYLNAAMWWNDHSTGYLWSRNSAGYGVVVCGLWKLTGVSIFTPLVVNMLAMLLTVIGAGVLTRQLLSGHTDWDDSKVAAGGMVAAACVTQFLFGGTLLLKEALTSLCLVSSAIGVVAISRRGDWGRGLPLFVVSAILLGVLRHWWVVIPISGLMLAIRRDLRHNLVLFGTGVVAVACWQGLDVLLFDGIKSVDMTHIVAGNRESSFIYDHSWRSAYTDFLISIRYFELPAWQQALWLPVTGLTQFLIPFPWNFLGDSTFPPTGVAIKFSYPWYLFGGVFVYYLLGKLRHSPRMLLGISLWAFVFWLGFAWLSAGTVSRYGATLVPLLAPAVVYVVASSMERKSFKVWCAGYAIMLIITLMVAYTLQN